MITTVKKMIEVLKEYEPNDEVILSITNAHYAGAAEAKLKVVHGGLAKTIMADEYYEE